MSEPPAMISPSRRSSTALGCLVERVVGRQQQRDRARRLDRAGEGARRIVTSSSQAVQRTGSTAAQIPIAGHALTASRSPGTAPSR